jgi:hypothetical protein
MTTPTGSRQMIQPIDMDALGYPYVDKVADDPTGFNAFSPPGWNQDIPYSPTAGKAAKQSLGLPINMAGMSSPVGSGPTLPPDPTQPMPTLPDSTTPTDSTKQGDSLYGKTNKELRELMRQLHPFGNAAGIIGGAVSAMSPIVNRPFYVNYQNVGRDEITQQNKALRRVVEGEKSALQGVTDSSRAASAQLANRSLQARNANLRNIAASEAQSKGKIRGQFAAMEGQMRNQIGARRTAIDQINMQKNMTQDQINTQEYDTLQKENLKALMNFRELALEKQGVMNQVRKDEILKNLLKSRSFQWDSSTNEIVMRALEGDPNALQALPSLTTTTTSKKKKKKNNTLNLFDVPLPSEGLTYKRKYR